MSQDMTATRVIVRAIPWRRSGDQRFVRSGETDAAARAGHDTKALEACSAVPAAAASRQPWIIDSAVLGGGSLPNYLLSDRNAIASDVSRKADAGSHLCGPACDAGVWGRWPTEPVAPVEVL